MSQAKSASSTNVVRLPTAARRKVDQQASPNKRRELSRDLPTAPSWRRDSDMPEAIERRFYYAMLGHFRSDPGMMVSTAMFTALPQDFQAHILSVLDHLILQTNSMPIRNAKEMLEFMLKLSAAPQPPSGNRA